jgi:hypothetical protein
MYCSIEEAFQSVVSPDKQPSARRSKRHKSGVLVSGFQNPPKISAPPAIPPQLPPPETDPDRPALPPAPAQYIGGGTGANNGAAAPMMGTDKPMFYSNILTAVDQDASYPAFPHPNDDMEGAERAYMLEPDWTTQFKGSTVPSWIRDRLASKSAEIPLKDVEPTWMDGESTLW